MNSPVDADQILAALDNNATADCASASHPVVSLARVEWEHIQRVLADCDCNLAEAGRLLGSHRRSLQQKLSKDRVPEGR